MVVRDQLKALVALAQIDGSAREVDDQLRGIPQELEERRLAVRSLEMLVAGQRAKLAEAERLLAQQDEELKNREANLARSKAKGAKARTMREAEAAERELEAMRRSIRDAETERERLQGLLAQTSAVLTEPLEQLAVQRKALEEAEQGAEVRLGELRGQREKTVVGRDEVARKVEKLILRRYERLRPKLHPAVVEAANGSCSGCRMALPAQFYIQIQKGQEVYQCPSCQRFLYHREQILD